MDENYEMVKEDVKPLPPTTEQQEGESLPVLLPTSEGEKPSEESTQLPPWAE